MIVLLSSSDIWLNCQALNMIMTQTPNETGSEQHDTLVTAAGAKVLLEYFVGERHSVILQTALRQGWFHWEQASGTFY